MSEVMYLVDNNALGPLGAAKETAFFAEHCRVPEEVAYESRRAKHAKLLEPLTVDMTPDMLAELRRVMKTVPVGDLTLLNLYTNQGAADPILVAMATVLSTETLDADEWVIVTNDKAVKAKAKEFGIATTTSTDLKKIIEALEPADEDGV